MQWIPTILANKLVWLLRDMLSYICYKFQRRKYLKVSLVFTVYRLRTLNGRRISQFILELFQEKNIPDRRPTTIWFWFCSIVSWKGLLDLLGTANSSQNILRTSVDVHVNIATSKFWIYYQYLYLTLFLSCRDKSTTSGIPFGIEIGYC